MKNVKCSGLRGRVKSGSGAALAGLRSARSVSGRSGSAGAAPGAARRAPPGAGQGRPRALLAAPHVTCGVAPCARCWHSRWRGRGRELARGWRRGGRDHGVSAAAATASRAGEARRARDGRGEEVVSRVKEKKPQTYTPRPPENQKEKPKTCGAGEGCCAAGRRVPQRQGRAGGYCG